MRSGVSGVPTLRLKPANAAELLGLSFRQFRYLLKKYEIQ